MENNSENVKGFNQNLSKWDGNDDPKNNYRDDWNISQYGDHEEDFDLSVNTIQTLKAIKKRLSDEDIVDSMGEVSKYQQWQVSSKGVYQAMGKIITHDKLPSGYYSLQMDQKGNIYASARNFIYDDYIDLPIKEYKEILKDIDKFWSIKDKFKEYGFVFKRGILIHGKQGLGKSFLINGVIKDVIEKREGIVFSLYNYRDLGVFHEFFRDQFRHIEPERPVVVVIEDIDGLCRDKSVETELINMLDGVEHSSNVVYLATTNNIDQLEERITNPPSRFDRRYHIQAPTKEVRKVFIEAKMKKDDLAKIDVDEWVEKTEGFNLAHIKELIISVVLYENDLEYALGHLNNMRTKPNVEGSFADGNGKMGFNGQ